MFLFRYYDKKNGIDRAWYQSSNILYSECDDVKDDFKILTVVFKNGATYKYYDVDVNDYVMFLHGGLDGSNGKALNKYIKQKCQRYERVEDRDTLDVMSSMNHYKKIAKEEKEKNEAESEKENN